MAGNFLLTRQTQDLFNSHFKCITLQISGRQGDGYLYGLLAPDTEIFRPPFFEKNLRVLGLGILSGIEASVQREVTVPERETNRPEWVSSQKR